MKKGLVFTLLLFMFTSSCFCMKLESELQKKRMDYDKLLELVAKAHQGVRFKSQEKLTGELSDSFHSALFMLKD